MNPLFSAEVATERLEELAGRRQHPRDWSRTTWFRRSPRREEAL